jgi:hypothetical protein
MAPRRAVLLEAVLPYARLLGRKELSHLVAKFLRSLLVPGEGGLERRDVEAIAGPWTLAGDWAPVSFFLSVCEGRAKPSERSTLSSAVTSSRAEWSEDDTARSSRKVPPKAQQHKASKKSPDAQPKKRRVQSLRRQEDDDEDHEENAEEDDEDKQDEHDGTARSAGRASIESTASASSSSGRARRARTLGGGADGSSGSTVGLSLEAAEAIEEATAGPKRRRK